MHRSMLQTYVKGAKEAIELYKRAFDAKLLEIHYGEDGVTVYHSEMDVHGQILAISDSPDEPVTGTTMQFCLHFGAGSEAVVQKAYDALKEGALKCDPLGPVDWSPLMADLTDKFGVRWCIFV